MNGFNPINFIVNTFAINAQNLIKNSQTGQSANNLAANSSNFNSNVNQALSQNSLTSINYSASTQQNQSGLILSNANQLVISTVEVEQRANYIKDLLNLPRDFQSFINQIQNMNTETAKSFAKILTDGKINLSALTELLAGNSKEAVQKLMMTIMTVSKMGSNNVSGLKELMAMFSVSANSSDSTQTVKNLLMLYLPWLPLSIRNEMNLDFDIDIFDKIQGADPDKEENIETIKIMIETANYGNVLAELEMAPNFEVDVYITAIESFPESEVLKRFNEENKKNSIRSNTKIEKTKDPENSQEFKQNVKITSSNFVSPKLVQSAHSLIKIIIEVDYSNFIINEEEEES